MVEEVVEEPSSKSKAHLSSSGGTSAAPVRLAQVDERDLKRIDPGIREFAQVLGGGIVPGSLILVGGDPGIGKSTLMLQSAIELAKSHLVLYVSGEESDQQIKMRAVRICEKKDGVNAIPDNLYLLTETNLELILAQAAALKPEIMVIDSIQTVQLPELESTAGSLVQVRESAGKLREVAKSSGISIFLIGHVTKEGMIAGPRVLEHIVDTVLYLEGDRFLSLRLLRSVKNRFGATSEVGVFDMADDGLRQVENPSEIFLAERMVNAPGSAVAVTMEGTRPILVEIQALTNPTSFGNPRRTPIGIDINRLFLISAVLSRRLGARLGEQDIYVNVVGGLRIAEPAADLPVAAAILSSVRNVPIRADAVLMGEIGLSGELRAVSKTQARLKEAEKLGFRYAILPKSSRNREFAPNKLKLIEVQTIREAIQAALISNKPATEEQSAPERTHSNEQQ
jgi:DNA repair protein RadA/Sms